MPAAIRSSSDSAAQLLAELRQQHTFLERLCEQVRNELGEIEQSTRTNDGEQARDHCVSLRANLALVADLARIDAGTDELAHEPFELHTIARSAVASQTFVADRRGVRLRCYLQRDTPTRVVGDRLRVRRILGYLVAKVVAGCDGGDLSVYVAPDCLRAKDAVVRFTICDRAAGPPANADGDMVFTGGFEAPSQLPWITPWFAVVGDLVQRMGGQLAVNGSEDDGIALWFTVRLDTEETAPKRAALAPHLPVLLVSNQPEHVPQVMVALQRCGFSVELEEDYRRVPLRLQQTAYCVVLMDREDGAHVATFASRAAGDVRMVPLMGVPRLANDPGRVDQEALVRMVQRSVAAARSRSE